MKNVVKLINEVSICVAQKGVKCASWLGWHQPKTPTKLK